MAVGNNSACQWILQLKKHQFPLNQWQSDKHFERNKHRWFLLIHYEKMLNVQFAVTERADFFLIRMASGIFAYRQAPTVVSGELSLLPKRVYTL